MKLSRFWSDFFCAFVLFIVEPSIGISQDFQRKSISGVYPHLAYRNPHGECGTGAVVPWAGKLWVITYGPHFPNGSQDKLYSIAPDLSVEVFSGSVGGTPANRMIHRETDQLMIGPYVIDKGANIRVLSPEKMPGRLTGSARHLNSPTNSAYYATMEEGIYEVDLRSLEIKTLFEDDQGQTNRSSKNEQNNSTKRLAKLPGYHGKGLFSGQGRLIYANNGEASDEALRRPDIASGCLAEWDGKTDSWTIIRRNQFTDVRGPGGLYGNASPNSDPIWAIGWDHKSLILMLLDYGQWYTYRLPKASHCYDGAHGWNTEWPRFGDIAEQDMLLNMHGMLWRFPKTFSLKNSSGIRPRSTHLKVFGDFCFWNNQVVFGCDDSAKNEFLNKRRAKGSITGPELSNSNLWFVDPERLDQLGPAIGRGAVWLDEDVTANTVSDPFLISGFDDSLLVLSHHATLPVTFTIEIDRNGTDDWTELTTLKVQPNQVERVSFEKSAGVWARIRAKTTATLATALFQMKNTDSRLERPDAIFDGIATNHSANVSSGVARVIGNGGLSLAFAATRYSSELKPESAYYELDGEMNLIRVEDPDAYRAIVEGNETPVGILQVDAASVIYVDDEGKRWRLPKSKTDFEREMIHGPERVDREVVTERDLFNCFGTFYELPARNAGGFAKVRPICTHNKRIKDYCSYRGLLIISGIDHDTIGGNSRIIQSADGKVALWAGVVDDLWKFGKPVGKGGPWFNTPVQENVWSDPYLISGYDKKTVLLSHDSKNSNKITTELDITGAGNWIHYQTFDVEPGQVTKHEINDDLGAYWIRFKCDTSTNASATLVYK